MIHPAEIKTVWHVWHVWYEVVSDQRYNWRGTILNTAVNSTIDSNYKTRLQSYDIWKIELTLNIWKGSELKVTVPLDYCFH